MHTGPLLVLKSPNFYQAMEFMGPYKMMKPRTSTTTCTDNTTKTTVPLVEISYASSPQLQNVYTFLRDEDIVDIECTSSEATQLMTHIKKHCTSRNMTDIASGLPIWEGYLEPIEPPPSTVSPQDHLVTENVENDKEETEQVSSISSPRIKKEHTNDLNPDDIAPTAEDILPPSTPPPPQAKRKRMVSFILIPLLACSAHYFYQMSKDFYFFNEFNQTEIARLSENKTIAITGASSGLGYSSAKMLALAGTAKIIFMGCRNMEKCTKAREDIMDLVLQQRGNADGDVTTITRLVPLYLNLESLQSVEAFAKQVQQVLEYTAEDDNGDLNSSRPPKLDILMNNAGIMGVALGDMAEDTGVDLQMHVNHLAHFALTKFLSPNLQNGSRIVSVSSLAGALSPKMIQFLERILPSSLQPIPLYAKSKRANLLFTHTYNRRFASTRGVEAVVAHPGYSRTSITYNWSFANKAFQNLMAYNVIGSMSSDFGALSQIRGALDVDHVQSNGYVGPLFYVTGRPVVVGSSAESFHHFALDEDNEGEILWAFSEQILQLKM